MPLFSPRDLADFRALNKDNLPSLAAIESPTVTRGDGGVETRAWDPVLSNVPCRVSRARGNTSLEQAAGGEIVTGMYMVTFDVDLGDSLNMESRLVVTGTDFGGNDWTLTLKLVDDGRETDFTANRQVMARIWQEGDL